MFSENMDMNSWHWHYYKGKSLIEEFLEALTEDRYLLIYTESDCFTVTSKNEIQLGEQAMMIGSDDVVCFINTNKITHLELHRSENLNKIKNTNINNNSLNDSEGE